MSEVVANFYFYCYVNLSKFVNFRPPWNQQKTSALLIISGGIEVNHLSANFTKWLNTL